MKNLLKFIKINYLNSLIKVINLYELDKKICLRNYLVTFCKLSWALKASSCCGIGTGSSPLHTPWGHPVLCEVKVRSTSSVRFLPAMDMLYERGNLEVYMRCIAGRPRTYWVRLSASFKGNPAHSYL